ncbi:MAG: phage tail protein [Acidobacteriota bacterium]
MDVNGSRYHLLLGEADWQPPISAAGDGIAWDRDRQRVTLAPELFRFPGRPGEEALTADHRRGADRDRYGHVYWISEDRREIHYRPRDSRRSGVFWPPEPCPSERHGAFGPLPGEPLGDALLSGLAVTADHYLVVGRRDPGGILIFDLHGGGPPRRLDWPEELDFSPHDLAAARDGGLWVLDRPPADGPRLWRLDHHLRPVPGDGSLEHTAATTESFKPLGGEPRQRPAETFPRGWQPASLALADPRAILVLPDGAVLVLDSPAGSAPRVHRFCGGLPDAPPADLEIALAELVTPVPEVTAHDFAFLPAPASASSPGELEGELLVADAGGNQAYAFRLRTGRGRLELVALPTYLPLRRFAGRALVDGRDACDVLYDRDDSWASLVELRRPRYQRRGELDALRFDGKQAGTVWHRLFLAGCIPPGDEVMVESRAADEEHLLADQPWQSEPVLGLRPGGGERPLDAAVAPSQGGDPGEGTWELLFQAARGRYLELRLTLVGSGRSSPALTALRVYYPRFSYLREYLPAVYREEPSFLERFLANFEGFFSEIEGKMERAETWFDPRTIPAEALPWLADWLAASFDEDWDEARRRLLLRHLHRLYRQRGTVAGMLAAVRLATVPCPDDSIFEDDAATNPYGVRLVEAFRSRQRALPGSPGISPATGPRLIAAGERWQPDQGAARLHQAYRDFLTQHHAVNEPLVAQLNELWGSDHPSDLPLQFPAQPPENPAEAASWRAFIARELDFPYAETTSSDTTSYRRYLRHRHGSVATLNAAWGLTGATAFGSFDEALLPAALPIHPVTLEDWIHFVSQRLPIARSAHRFQVLVPVTADSIPSEREKRLAQVRAVVERQRPAHTSCEVSLYWALFRVGSARVGIDSVVGEGSRATALTLGRGALGESQLSQPHPWNVHDRRVIGRDAVA